MKENSDFETLIYTIIMAPQLLGSYLEDSRDSAEDIFLKFFIHETFSILFLISLGLF